MKRSLNRLNNKIPKLFLSLLLVQHFWPISKNWEKMTIQLRISLKSVNRNNKSHQFKSRLKNPNVKKEKDHITTRLKFPFMSIPMPLSPQLWTNSLESMSLCNKMLLKKSFRHSNNKASLFSAVLLIILSLFPPIISTIITAIQTTQTKPIFTILFILNPLMLLTQI